METVERAYLTAKEVAARLGVSRQTLSYWRSRNEGPESVKLGGVLRYPVAALEEWEAEQRRLHTRGGVRKAV